MPNLAQKMLNDIRAERIRQARIKVPTRELKVPRNLENSYASKLRAYQKEINRQLLDALQPLIDTYRQDATTEQIETVTKGAGAIIGEAIVTGAVLSNLVQTQGNNVLNWNDKKYSADFYTVLGFNAIPPEYRSEALQSWTKENIQLIKNVNDEQISKIETLMLRSSRDGTVKTNLTKEITKIMESSVKRATLIATDQVLKLNGQIDRLKQSEAGITHFIWRTAGDERVRTKHRQFSGNKYPWKGGANGIYPGTEVRCRCWSEPSLEEVLGPEYRAAPAQPIKEPLSKKKKAPKKPIPKPKVRPSRAKPTPVEKPKAKPAQVEQTEKLKRDLEKIREKNKKLQSDLEKTETNNKRLKEQLQQVEEAREIRRENETKAIQIEKEAKKKLSNINRRLKRAEFGKAPSVSSGDLDEIQSAINELKKLAK